MDFFIEITLLHLSKQAFNFVKKPVFVGQKGILIE